MTQPNLMGWQVFLLENRFRVLLKVSHLLCPNQNLRDWACPPGSYATA